MAITRTAVKNKINKVLTDVTKGLHDDNSWVPVYKAFEEIRALGFDVAITDSHYTTDAEGHPDSKCWKFEVKFGKKPIFGIITAHGAGSVEDPLGWYDVSAYVS